MAAPDLRAHPCYDRAVRIYRNALTDWNGNEYIRTSAQLLGMDQRAYCDARITANQFQWYSASTGEAFTREHLDAAWLDVHHPTPTRNEPAEAPGKTSGAPCGGQSRG